LLRLGIAESIYEDELLNMLAPWQRPFRLSILYEDWEDAPTYSGVYIISGDKEIPRIAGTDKAGILYVGKSTKLRDRLWGFWDASHVASSYLWDDLKLAGLVLGVKTLSRYGELPPLNATLPNRWSKRLNARLLRWAKSGFTKP
jgi:hypothetical protein